VNCEQQAGGFTRIFLVPRLTTPSCISEGGGDGAWMLARIAQNTAWHRAISAAAFLRHGMHIAPEAG